jgi:hypothetical protein
MTASLIDASSDLLVLLQRLAADALLKNYDEETTLWVTYVTTRMTYSLRAPSLRSAGDFGQPGQPLIFSEVREVG